jgi:hypothetical protein
MAKDPIPATDNGTRSACTLVFDQRGYLIAMSRLAIAPCFSTHPGRTEPEPAWRTVQATLSPPPQGAITWNYLLRIAPWASASLPSWR